jgi:hypothetical protein
MPWLNNNQLLSQGLLAGCVGGHLQRPIANLLVVAWKQNCTAGPWRETGAPCQHTQLKQVMPSAARMPAQTVAITY